MRTSRILKKIGSEVTDAAGSARDHRWLKIKEERDSCNTREPDPRKEKAIIWGKNGRKGKSRKRKEKYSRSNGLCDILITFF